MQIREADEEDLTGLLELCRQLYNNPMPHPSAKLYSLWVRILKNKEQHVVVGIIDGTIMSSCVLTVIPDLTHEQRPYGAGYSCSSSVRR